MSCAALKGCLSVFSVHKLCRVIFSISSIGNRMLHQGHPQLRGYCWASVPAEPLHHWCNFTWNKRADGQARTEKCKYSCNDFFLYEPFLCECMKDTELDQHPHRVSSYILHTVNGNSVSGVFPCPPPLLLVCQDVCYDPGDLSCSNGLNHLYFSTTFPANPST